MADESFAKLDEIADTFERQWEQGECPRIEDYLSGLEGEAERLAALRELIEIELEHALRRDAQLALTATSGLLIDDYVRRFPQLAASDEVARELAVAEYRARHRFGDAPRMNAFVERFPRCPGIKYQLRQVLTRMLKAQVRVYEKTTLLLITPFDQELHLGRQRSTDPEPHRRVDEPYRARLLIASDLWKLLVVITVRKIVSHQRRDFAQKRGGGAVRGESVFVVSGQSDSPRGIEQVLGGSPSPELATEFGETLDGLVDQLEDDRLKTIVASKLEGYTNREIADRLGCTERTVERKLERIRQQWGDVLNTSD